jgi:membrane-bound ClpP family serine protease
MDFDMWIAISALILIGLVLIVVEIIFIPGTTVVGFIGLAFLISGIVFTYQQYGKETGFYVLLGTGVLSATVLYVSFKRGAWNKFSNKSSIDSKVNEGLTKDLVVGDEGTTVSVLRPIGNAEFKGKIFEVKTTGGYLANGIKIRIGKIQSNEILVEQIQ